MRGHSTLFSNSIQLRVSFDSPCKSGTSPSFLRSLVVTLLLLVATSITNGDPHNAILTKRVRTRTHESKGLCCKKTDCQNCENEKATRDTCNPKYFRSWCEGGEAGSNCIKSSCFPLGDVSSASPTASLTDAPSPSPMGLDCSTPAATPSISLALGSWNSDWKALTLDKESRSSIKAVKVQVTTGGGGGNVIRIWEEWSPPDIVTYTMPGGTPTVEIGIPPGSNARLQIRIENIQRVAYEVKLFLCKCTDTSPGPTPSPTPTGATPSPTPTGATPSPTPTDATPSPTPTDATPSPTRTCATPSPTPTDATPSPTPADATPNPTLLPVGVIPIPVPPNQPPGDLGASAKKDGLPPIGNLSANFGEWPSSHLIEACKECHDKYWVYGPDGVAYHTWHPVSETVVLSDGESYECNYGHEHGSNPYNSPLFELFGGWPPFGYLLAQQSARMEDHVGHKVNVATFNAAKGEPQRIGTTLEYAGFDCHFISKIHQGSWSEDAFTNHLHEYYVAAACNDEPDSSGGTTWFSIKLMVPFGSPNTFIEICPDYMNVTVSIGDIIGLDGTPLTETQVITPPGTGNREFQCFTENIHTEKKPYEMAQPNLWVGEAVVHTGTGSVNVAPYYVVKDGSRTLDVTDGVYSVKRTIDFCYDENGNPQYTDAYCTGVPQNKPAWDDPASPFKGTLRAVNFKRFQIYNEGSFANVEVCTDFLGNYIKKATSPTACDVTAGEVYQAVADVKNVNTWSKEVQGSLLGATPDPDNAGKFCAPGIGHEHLETHSHPTVRGQN